MDFRYQSLFEHTLPTPAEQPVLGQNESLHRFLLRSTARDPDARFQSADEMMDQLGGVLRDLVAGNAPARPVESNLFGGDVMALHEDEDGLRPSAALLPELKVDPDDPSSHFVMATAAVAQPLRRAEAYRRGLLKQPEAAELRLRLAQSLIEAGQYPEAETELAGVAAKNPWDWRVHWYRGASLLAQGKAREAHALFDRVYSELPGEPAVKLAVALAAETAGDLPLAVRLYDRVSLVDPGFTTACFGLARCLTAQGKRTEAVEAYTRVPASSSLYSLAQMALTRALLRPEPTPPGTPELLRASATVEALAAEGRAIARLRVEVFDNALTLVGAKKVVADAAARLLGQPLEETALRTGLEHALRQLARLEPERDQQIALIDRANQVRPRTWV
jgi:serine/threonine-protein kinase PknG